MKRWTFQFQGLDIFRAGLKFARNIMLKIVYRTMWQIYSIFDELHYMINYEIIKVLFRVWSSYHGLPLRCFIFSFALTTGGRLLRFRVCVSVFLTWVHLFRRWSRCGTYDYLRRKAGVFSSRYQVRWSSPEMSYYSCLRKVDMISCW